MTVYFRRKASPTEDALTGMIADLLDWWRCPDVVDRLLNVARRFDVHGLAGTRGIPIGAWDAVHVEAWPTWSVGQPDLVLRFEHRGAAVASLIIEAKLRAPKSGEAGAAHVVSLLADDGCPIPSQLQSSHVIDCSDHGATSKLLSQLSLLLRRARGAMPTEPNEAIRFVSFRIHAGDCNWAELPHNTEHSPFENTTRYFELIELVRDGHPTFDITLLNTSGSPVILTRLGFQIVHACTIRHGYGFPQPAKVPIMDAYELAVPMLRDQFGKDVSRDVNRLVSFRLNDPIYIPDGGPYRHSLRLVDYVRNAPNHSIIRFWGETSKGQAWSESAETFTL
jgi:hypothetical protein